MIKLSEVHHWQGDAAVRQILVFPSQTAMDAFNIAHADEVKSNGVQDASDTNMGAMYKIRAVMNGDGTWSGLVRCGVTGYLLQETKLPTPNWALAMLEAFSLLQRSMIMPVPVDLIKQMEEASNEEVS